MAEAEAMAEAELIVSFMGVIIAGYEKGGGNDEVFLVNCKPCCGIKGRAERETKAKGETKDEVENDFKGSMPRFFLSSLISLSASYRV
jgi:hypothetical protein